PKPDDSLSLAPPEPHAGNAAIGRRFINGARFDAQPPADLLGGHQVVLDFAGHRRSPFRQFGVDGLKAWTRGTPPQDELRPNLAYTRMFFGTRSAGFGKITSLGAPAQPVLATPGSCGARDRVDAERCRWRAVRAVGFEGRMSSANHAQSRWPQRSSPALFGRPD